METNSTIKEGQDILTEIIVFCPHCQDPIVIEKLNCCIFRHGTLIYGCGKPFQIIRDEKDELVAVVCGYI